VFVSRISWFSAGFFLLSLTALRAEAGCIATTRVVRNKGSAAEPPV